LKYFIYLTNNPKPDHFCDRSIFPEKYSNISKKVEKMLAEMGLKLVSGYFTVSYMLFVHCPAITINDAVETTLCFNT